jgi:Domain of unknown function (DUF4234)
MTSDTPAQTPPSPPPVARGGTGPLGKVRSPVTVILLSIVTLGIYHLFWIYYVYKELKDHTNEGIGGVIGLVIALVIGLVNLFVLPSEIGNMYDRAGLEKPVRGVTGFWNLIPLIGFIIWTVKVQNALNRVWEGAVAA